VTNQVISEWLGVAVC